MAFLYAVIPHAQELLVYVLGEANCMPVAMQLLLMCPAASWLCRWSILSLYPSIGLAVTFKSHSPSGLLEFCSVGSMWYRYCR